MLKIKQMLTKLSAVIYVFIILFFTSFINAQDLNWKLFNQENINEFSQSNITAFWSSIDDNIEQELSLYLDYQGWILGDAHPDNFSFLFNQNKWALVADDFDDGGIGAFVYDLLRFTATDQSLGDSQINHLIYLYTQGLCGTFPNSINKISQSNFTRPQLSDEVDQYTKKFISTKRMMFPLPKVIKSELQKFLPNSKILDSIITSRNRGGSAGSERYWLLVENEQGHVQHFEFKKNTASSINIYQKQDEQDDRLENLIKTYWPTFLDSNYKIVKLFEENFLMRERFHKPLKGYQLKKNISLRFELYKYSIQYLGYSHGQQIQGKDLCSVIQENPKSFRDQIFKVTKMLRKDFGSKFQQMKIKNDKISFFGDLRYRLQNRKAQDADSRAQQKIRARFGSEFLLPPYFTGRFSVSTGNSPTSANANLGDSFSYKTFGIHEASLGLRPFESLNLNFGKMALPFVSVGDSELLWDETLTPEGVALKWENKKGLFQPFFNLGYFMLLENYRKKKGIDQADNNIISAQLGFKSFWNNWQFTLGTGPIRYSKIRGTEFIDIGKNAQLGNSVDGDGNYIYDFHLAEFFTEILYRQKFDFSVFFHSVYNSQSEENKAFRYGLSILYSKFEMIYAYRQVEKDSVFGFFTESNFAFGGANQKGHELSLKCRIQKDSHLKLTQQWAQLGVKEKESRMSRTHLDLSYKF